MTDMEKYIPLITSLGVLIIVLLVLLGSVMIYATHKSNQDFPFGVEPEEGRWSGDAQTDTQVNSQPITLDSANAENLRRLNEAVSNWDNENTNG